MESQNLNIAKMVQENTKPQICTLEGSEHQYGIIPNGMQIASLKHLEDERREKPERRKGTTEAKTLQSFIDLTNRFKAAHSSVFAHKEVTQNVMDASLKTILNYHPEGQDNKDANNCDHQIVYKFPIAEEFKSWLEQNCQAMNQIDFAAFIEDRIPQLVIYDKDAQKAFEIPNANFADPMTMYELSRGLEVHTSDQLAHAVNLDTGEKELKFKSEHQDRDGKKLVIPNFFMIRVPVMDGGEAYEIAARLRYRKRDTSLVWSFELYRPDLIINRAFSDACALVGKETELPIFQAIHG